MAMLTSDDMAWFSLKCRHKTSALILRSAAFHAAPRDSRPNQHSTQACVDLQSLRGHIRFMDFDISPLLDHSQYKPGQVVVRKFKGKDGTEKIQLRVDLAL